MNTQSTPLRVVMVDNDPDDIFLTKSLTKLAPVPVNFRGFDSAGALFEFIQMSGIEAIDVILLDINMPIENSYDALKKLKTHPHMSAVTIVIFSALVHLYDKPLALKLGASGLIQKPARIKEANELFDFLSVCYEDRQPVSRPQRG